MKTKFTVFLYFYTDEFTRFEELSLPSQASFYYDLKQKDIRTEEYSLVKEIWNIFECEN